MAETVPFSCRVCGARGTPTCVMCPTKFSRWTRATCMFAWRWRLATAWVAVGSALVVTLAVVR